MNLPALRAEAAQGGSGCGIIGDSLALIDEKKRICDIQMDRSTYNLYETTNSGLPPGRYTDTDMYIQLVS